MPLMSPDPLQQARMAAMAPSVFQHPMHAMIAPIAPAPEPAPMMMSDDSQPNTPATPKPQVRMASPLERYEESIGNRMTSNLHKDTDPWGSLDNHPGILGKLGHGLNDFAKYMQHSQGKLTQRESQEQQDAKTLEDMQKETSEEALQGANTAHINAETPEVAPNAESTRNLQGEQAKNLESETRDRDLTASYGPQLATAYAHRVNEVISQGGNPSDDPIVQHLQDAITGIQKQSDKSLMQSQPVIGPDGKPHTYLINPQTGEKVGDEGVHYERPITVNAGDASLDREATRLAKPYEKGVSDANSQLEKIADARTMINGSAEAQALGVPKVLTALVSGAGSGVRITQPELNAIAKARGLSGDVEGTINSWAGKGKLTKTQQQQLSGILDDVRSRIIAKQAIHNETLDRINGAGSREEIIQADKDARKKISDIESSAGKETREYQGHTYEKGDDGQWHLQQKK